MNKILIRRFFMITVFIFFNIVILTVIGQIYYQFNSGANREDALHTTYDYNNTCASEITITLSDKLKTIPTKAQIKQIKEDYINAWCTKFHAMRYNEKEVLNDFFTDSAQVKIEKVLEYNESKNIYIHGSSLNHNLHIDFFSVDGQFVSFKDDNSLIVEQLYEGSILQTQDIKKSSYKVVMLLEDGFWRIRHMISEEVNFDKNKKTNYREIDNEVINGINYYPKDNPWLDFWEKFDETVIKADFLKIRNLNFNTVRIFIPYSFFNNDDNEKYLNYLKKTLDLAEENELKLILTFFDFYGGYDVLDYGACDKYLKTVINKIKKHKAIHHYDLKNEPDLDFDRVGQDKVIEWLKFVESRARVYDDETPITIGWSSITSADKLKENVDIISFHHYQSPNRLVENYKMLRDITKKPIILQEYGMHSLNAYWFPFSNSEYKQAKFYQEMNNVFKFLEINNTLSWTLYDYPKIENDVFGSLPHKKIPQMHYGIFDANGNEKLVAKTFFKGKPVSSNPLNMINKFYLLVFVLLVMLILWCKKLLK